MTPAVEFRDVTKRFPGAAAPALDRVSLVIDPGELVCVLGTSGGGKTTFIKLINRLHDPDSGTVLVNGQDVSQVDPVELRRGIGYVIQQIGLFPNMTVAQNICVVPNLLKYSKEACDKIVHELLELVNLPYEQYAHKYPSEMSGGQQQRIGILRALAASPPIVLMDEPFSALDPMTRRTLQQEVRSLQQKLNKTFVFVTHDMEEALDLADVIIFIVDVRQGLVDSDSKVADMLRKSRKPVVLAVNKVDSFEKFGNDVYEFYNLGIGDPVPVSAASRLGLGELLDEVAKHFTPDQYDDEEDDRPRVAIVGKPNVGKSSIINKMLGENRVIVSDIAGTTRDAVDTEVIHNGTEYVFIDTAGLRRKSKVKEDIERYSIIRTVTAVDRADVVLMVIDATQGVTEQDAKIAGIAHDRGKGIIVVVNKWDAIEKTDKTIYEYTNKLKETLAYMPYACLLYTSPSPRD